MKFLTFSLIVTLFSPLQTASQSLIDINPQRDELLKNAFTWLTLRSNGDLLTDSQRIPFQETLRERYRSSKYYRSFVIAFQLGVLPKLTLQEGASCDPTYTKQYKDPFNNSVTWCRQKSFTLDNYYVYARKYNGSYRYPASYCDYRQGLVCLHKTGKCGCPEGSTMDYIVPSSQEKRCVLDENEVCSFVDLEESQVTNKLSDNLYHLIFNLEKPLGCKHGTQCRYTNSEDISRCYNNNAGQAWTKPRDELEYGDECVLGLYAEKGVCGMSYNPGFDTLMICYNYWGHLANRPLPSSVTSTRIGFCALEFAPFLTQTILRFNYIEEIGVEQVEPFVKAYVNPRTVPMRNYDLRSYDDRLQEITENYLYHRIMETEGGPCSVSETTQLNGHWKFYADLEKTPSSGQDYVADETQLDDELNEMENLVGTPVQGRDNPKFCRVMWQKKLAMSGKIELKQPYDCISTGGPADKDGNDGTCQRSSSNESFAFAESIYEFFLHWNQGKWSIELEEQNVDEDIFKENPEVECIPDHTEHVSAPLGRADVINGGQCPDGHICYEDLSDSTGIYLDQKLCVVDFSTVFHHVCHDASKPYYDLGECEIKTIQKKISELFEKLPRRAHGEGCEYRRDRKIRNLVAGGDYSDMGYHMLVTLEAMVSRGQGICDATRLLECSTSNYCQCVQDTERRTDQVEDELIQEVTEKHYSDFCYAKNGVCKVDITGFVAMTESEKKDAYHHYGNFKYIEPDCSNGNICVYIDAEAAACTKFLTGKTGVDGGQHDATTKPPRWKLAGVIERAKPYGSGSISAFIFNRRWDLNAEFVIILMVTYRSIYMN